MKDSVFEEEQVNHPSHYYEKRITGGVAEAIKSKLPLIIFDDSF